MREIEFRGLRTDGKGWVYGMLAYVFNNKKNTSIMENCCFATRDWDEEDDEGNPIICEEMALGGFINVIPESVGQYIGLNDKNGTKIFEGDYDTDFDVVEWCENSVGYQLKTYDHETNELIHCNCYNCEGNFNLVEVVDEGIEIEGNIHETK